MKMLMLRMMMTMRLIIVVRWRLQFSTLSIHVRLRAASMVRNNSLRSLRIMGCLHDPANVQQFTCILNTFAGSLLDFYWIV